MVLNFGLSAAGASERATLWGSKYIKYRLGRRFMALDYAGNVLLYRAYREGHFGGWAPMTVLDPTALATDPHHPSGMATLISNVPLHIRAAGISEKVVDMLTKHKRFMELDFERFLKEKHVTIIKEMAADEVANKKKISDGEDQSSAAKDVEAELLSSTPKPANSNHPATPKDAPPSTLNFAKQLGLKAHKEGLNPEHFVLKDEFKNALGRKHLFRLNRFVTWAYKGVYYASWALFGVFMVVLYTRFKWWLNPPARQGLERIEDDWLWYPAGAVFWLLDTFVYPLSDLLDDFIYADDVYGDNYHESNSFDATFPEAADACRQVVRPAVEGARGVVERVTSVAMQRAYLQKQREREEEEMNAGARARSRGMRMQALIASLLALLALLML